MMIGGDTKFPVVPGHEIIGIIEETGSKVTGLKNGDRVGIGYQQEACFKFQCNHNYKQLYGTQVVWTTNGEASGFRPIIEEDKADERRNEIGLQPLQIYALTYGFNYQKPTTAQARQNDSAENVNVYVLMDSAKYFYSKKEFQKTYDYYNTASTFPGGMNNANNFEAAIVFSKIGAVGTDEKYKSIASDFLNLLYIRRSLTKKQLLKEPAFKVLYKEQRWLDMIKQLN